MTGGLWEDLSAFAPHTKGVWEITREHATAPTLGDIPDVLSLPDLNPQSPDWEATLGSPSELDAAVSNRELFLRYAISRAIVDQGSDVAGVEMWHRLLLEGCYEAEIPILHDPASFVAHYSTVLAIGDAARDDVIEARAPSWADASPGKRSVGQYSPFTVDGQRGGVQAHWFLSARLFPALLLAHSNPGGLVALVFAGPEGETPLTMSRRIRNDRVTGLGHCIGDKATDLFTKWVIGTLGLVPEGRGWSAMDVPIPMDQRIGRVMMRSGFMDEFYGVAPLMRKHGDMWSDETKAGFPADPDELPPTPFYLRVLEFRRHARPTSRHEAAEWLDAAWRLRRTGRRPVWPPQVVVGLLCEALSEDGRQLTPVHIDDVFMNVAEQWCTDRDPLCDECVFSEVCQANMSEEAVRLKMYFT